MIKLVAVDMDGTFLDDQMHYNRTIFKGKRILILIIFVNMLWLLEQLDQENLLK